VAEQRSSALLLRSCYRQARKGWEANIGCSGSSDAEVFCALCGSRLAIGSWSASENGSYRDVRERSEGNGGRSSNGSSEANLKSSYREERQEREVWERRVSCIAGGHVTSTFSSLKSRVRIS
jgi:hypothetical protein